MVEGLNQEYNLKRISHTDPVAISRMYVTLGPIIIKGDSHTMILSHLEEIIRQKQPSATRYQIIEEKPVLYDNTNNQVIKTKDNYFCVETYKKRHIF